MFAGFTPALFKRCFSGEAVFTPLTSAYSRYTTPSPKTHTHRESRRERGSRRQSEGSTGSREGECEDGASSHLRLCAGRRRAARGGAAAVGIRSRVGVLLSGLVCRSPQGAAAGSSSRGDGCLHLLLLLDRRSRWLLVTWRWRSHCSSSYCRRSCWAETSSSSRAGQQRPSSSTLASRSAPSRASTGAAARRLGRPP